MPVFKVNLTYEEVVYHMIAADTAEEAVELCKKGGAEPFTNDFCSAWDRPTAKVTVEEWVGEWDGGSRGE